MISLIATEMARCELASPELEAWLYAVAGRWQRIRSRINVAPITLGSNAFVVMWGWLDLWADWRVATASLAMQRAALFGGRENTAAGISKARIFLSRWLAFLAQLQIDLRSGEVLSTELNISTMFAERMLAACIQFSGFLSIFDPLTLSGQQAVLVSWIQSLHVDPIVVGNKIASPLPDPASRWLSGLELLEAQLSVEHIRRIFFVRGASSSPGGST